MKRFLIAVLSCGLLILVVGAQGRITSDTSNGDVQISIKTRQSNTAVIPITVKAGDEIVITLDSNITTGYKWQLTEKPKSKIAVFVKSTYNNPEQAIPGRGGSESWTFKAVGKGSTVVTLKYNRAWEKNAASVRVQKLQISVQ